MDVVLVDEVVVLDVVVVVVLVVVVVVVVLVVVVVVYTFPERHALIALTTSPVSGIVLLTALYAFVTMVHSDDLDCSPSTSCETSYVTGWNTAFTVFVSPGSMVKGMSISSGTNSD